MKKYIIFAVFVFSAVTVACFATADSANVWVYHPAIVLAGFCAIARYAWYIINKEIESVDVNGVNL